MDVPATAATPATIATAAAAAVAVANLAAPAKAEYIKVKPGVVKQLKNRIHNLWCAKGSGDVVASPIIRNLTGKTIPAGRAIYWTAKYADGTKISGSHTIR